MFAAITPFSKFFLPLAGLAAAGKSMGVKSINQDNLSVFKVVVYN
jgi:hypothetical protein